jgi:hypothetical protein
MFAQPYAAGMPGSVSMTYALSEAELVAALRAQFWRTRIFRISCGVGLLFVLLGGVLFARSQVAVGFVALAAGLVQFTLMARTGIRGPARVWRSRPELRAPVTLDVTDEGVSATSGAADGWQAWSGFIDVTERGPVYLMKFGSASTTSSDGFVRIVPKRAFATPGDEAAFRRLAAAHTATNFAPLA